MSATDNPPVPTVDGDVTEVEPPHESQSRLQMIDEELARELARERVMEDLGEEHRGEESQELYFQSLRLVRSRTQPLREYLAKSYLGSFAKALAAVHQTTGGAALVMIGISIYVLGSDWGGLDPGFFVEIGVCSFLFSLVVFLHSCLGWSGVSRLVQRYSLPVDLPPPTAAGPAGLAVLGCLTRRSLNSLYIATLVVGMAAEVYVLSHTFNALESFTKTAALVQPQLSNSTLVSGDVVPVASFSALETDLSDRFNSFFFGAVDSCTNPNFGWYWDWIAKECASTSGHSGGSTGGKSGGPLDLNTCVSCEGSLLTYCAADSATCYSTFLNSVPGRGPACPFTLCRYGATRYMISQVGPFAYTLLAVLLVQSIVLVLTLVLILSEPGHLAQADSRVRGGTNGKRSAGFLDVLVRSGTLATIEGAVSAAARAEPLSLSTPATRHNAGGSGAAAGCGGGNFMGWGPSRSSHSRHSGDNNEDGDEDEQLRLALALSLAQPQPPAQPSESDVTREGDEEEGGGEGEGEGEWQVLDDERATEEATPLGGGVVNTLGSVGTGLGSLGGMLGSIVTRVIPVGDEERGEPTDGREAMTKYDGR